MTPDPGRHVPAIVAGSRCRSRDAILDRAARAAGGFELAGIGETDAVSLLLRNDFAFFEATIAAALAGASPVPINWHASPDDAAYILRDCHAKALVAHADLLTPDLLAAIHPERQRGLLLLVVDTPEEIRTAFAVDEPPARWPGAVPWGAVPWGAVPWGAVPWGAVPWGAVPWGAVPWGAVPWDEWVRRHTPIARPREGTPSPVIYTSGTTGRPKGVRRSSRSRSTGSRKALAVYGFDRGGAIKVLINGPMYHSVPNAYARLALQVGADIVLQPRFDPEGLLAMIADHRVTHMHIVPAMLVRLLRLPAEIKARYKLSSLRHVVHGAAPCPRAVKMAMIAWWGPILHEYYGSTETGLLTLHGSDEARDRPGTVGRALPGITLAILDASGQPLPPGATGEVYAGSSTLRDFTYIGDDAKRAAIGRGALVTAGDIGWMDADGYLYLCDRKRDVIVFDGTEIFPARIEAALLEMSAVRDCAVFGLPDAAHGDIICVCLELFDEAYVERHVVTRHVSACVEGRDPPVRIEIVDALPREESGKIFKQMLRERFAAAADDIASRG